jgi:hypothetical protein
MNSPRSGATAVRDAPEMAQAVTELIPGRLFAIAGTVATDRPTTWIAPHLRDRLAVSCYVLKDAGEALVIDTGLAAHREPIADGLAAVLAGTGKRSLIMTRREPDAIINLPWLIKRFGIDPVYCGGILSPLDFFERLDRETAAAHINAIADIGVTWLNAGAVIPIGALRLRVLRTTLCVLPKSHLYEERTRSLFASDSWGFLTQVAESGVGTVTARDGRLSRDAVAAYLRHKFDWLLGIDTGPVQQDVAHLLADREIDRICPGYGCVIEGADLVRHVIDETVAAIASLAQEPMADRLRGFDRAMFERATGAASR